MKVLPLLIALAACGTDTVSDDADDTPPPAQPVYYGQVQAILNANCVECHSAVPDRLAPFSLVGYDDAVAAATDFPMAYDVMNRIMPPYFAEQDGDCGTFPNAHWLSDDDLSTLTAWINGGKLAGDPADSVAPPPPPDGLPKVDRTLAIGSYLPNTATSDDYECFVVDALGADKFVVGAHVHPGNLAVVHHVIVFTLDQAAETDVLARQAAAGGGPYRCDGGPTQAGNAAFLIGWVPGNQATMFPADTGIEVDGARKLVVQVHYNTANANGLPDDTTVDLDLEAAVTTPAQMIRIAAPIDLPAHSTDATAVGTLRIPNQLANAKLWGNAVHMHNRGIGADLISNGDRCLMNLVNWSFHWQHFYWYDEPQILHGGDTVSLTCHFDTSTDTDRVRNCETTECEMCIDYGYVTR